MRGWLRPRWPAPVHVQALCTTRAGGSSVAPFDTFNLGTHVGDMPQAVQRNRDRHQRLMAVRTVYLHQVHGTEVQLLTAASHHAPPVAAAADASCTQQTGLACTVMMADCLPVLFTDVTGTAVAAAHAGWRGLAGGVLENTVDALTRLSAVTSTDVIAWLGPCIGRGAFAVGADVYSAFVQQHAADAHAFSANVRHNTGDRADSVGKAPGYWCDLALLARHRLRRLGISQCCGNDSSPKWCTYTQWQRYFSHRRDTARLGETGRMAASIWLTRRH